MIGQRIKEARQALGYSAEQVASFLNVAPATVYRYENGDISKLPAKFIRPLADYLCVSPAYLMGWDGTSSAILAPDEMNLIVTYRSLSPRGKELLHERCEELKLLYGKKSEDSAAESV